MNRIRRPLAGAFLFLFAAIAAAAPQLVVPVSGPSAVAAKDKLAATAVRFNGDELFALVPGNEAELTLPSGARHTYIFERMIDHGGGFTTWIARSPVTGDNERAIITRGPAGAWGWMRTHYGNYRIFPDAGHEWLQEQPPMDYSPRFAGGDAIRAPSDDLSLAPVKGVPTFLGDHLAQKAYGMEKAAPTPSLQADIMVIYTKDLAQKLGVGLMPMIYNLIATTNQAYIDSEIALSLRLVNATMLDYPNANGSTDTLNGMGGSGPFSSIFQSLTWDNVGTPLRNVVGADLVALVRDGPTDTGGIAFLVDNPSIYPTVSVTSSYAYSVINFCAGGCQGIFTHEIGHNLGGSHDRATVARDNGGTVAADGVFPYSFGHYSCANGLTCNPFVAGGCPSGYAQCKNLTPNDFGSVMSYFGPQLLKYSNPNINCLPAGGTIPAPCGLAGQDDNALSFNNVRQNIAAYRTQTITALPGSLQFTNTAYTGTEASGTIAFTVSRASGSTGAVSVNYTLTGGTATSGVDFTAANGTLSWADGDATNKTISVAVANDLSIEGIESFTVTLSNPSGATGVYLGYPTVATGLILENWPVGGAMPAGWVQPASPASSVPWAVDNTTSYDGDGFSLKSGQIDFSLANRLCTDPGYGAVPCPSSVDYTGTFAAGTISFAYRVSSFPNNGFLEFLIDGTVAFSASGSSANTSADTGWLLTSIPITAGAHTIRWRYRPVFYFPCAGASSGGAPPYPGCLDRAWIDSVSLPFPLSTATTALVSSVNPSSAGQAVTFTATVSGGAGTPAGTVQFRDGATPIAGCTWVALAAGSAACTTSALAGGSHSITAVYSGSLTYATSTSSAVSQVVSLGPQLLSANPASLDFGGQSMNTTSPALTTTITNTSGGSVTVTSVTPPTGYAVSSNTCTTLAPSATCVIGLTFTPAPGTPGTVAGSLAISYAGGGPTVVSLTGIAELSLVTHYYRSILRRAPDSAGKTFWDGEATRVSGLGANVNETWFAMAMNFYFSSEYAAFNRDNTGFVTDLYTTFFNRPPDSAGLTFWTGQLGSGLPREVALASFMFSAEFGAFTQAIFGNTSVRPEINVVVDFYRGLLSRLPDSSGFTFWLQQFRTAQCQGGAAVNTQVEAISSAYANSAEYAARARTNAQYVGDLYNAFLRRGGDLAGVQFWINQIATSAQTRDAVRKQFVASAEFQARVSAVIAQTCLP